MALRVLTVALRSHRDLVLENLVLRHQLEVLQRTKPKPRLRNRDRILWVWLRRLWRSGWARHLRIVEPKTVIGWHRKGWRLYWTWRSSTRLGRPRLGAEVRELIAAMSRDNSLWGTFLRNQVKGIWAADLFVVQTIGFRTLYVLFFISHARRELIHFNVTASPTAAWIWRQWIEATASSRQPQHLIHDRDKVFGDDFAAKLAALGIKDLRTPYRAPLANSIAERVVRSFRHECLDHIIVINEPHLIAVLSEYVHYYNHERSHRTLELATPVPAHLTSSGEVVRRPILGGLHHSYARAA